MPRAKDYHECTLSSKVIEPQLYPLPPNASRTARLLRRIRTLCSLDPKNVKSRQFFRNKSTMFAEQKRHANKRYKFVIHPFSKLNTIIEILFFMAWLWQYFSVPILFMFKSRWINVVGLKFIVNIVQYCVFISFFFVGYVDNRKKEIIIEPKRIVLHYLRTHFIFDLIAVFYDNVILLLLSQGVLEEEYYKCNYFASLVVIIAYFTRFKCFMRTLENITIMLYMPKTVYNLLFHLFIVTVAIHIFTCSVFSIPKLFYENDFPSDSWMVQAHVSNISEVPFIDLYSESLLIAVCFFFGIGNDKYRIVHPEEEIILTFISIFGRLYTLYMIADLLKMFGLVGISESKYEQYLGQLEEYMSSKNLPDELRIRLLKYYEYKLQKHYFNENQILATLSEHLRIEMFLFGARKLIEKAQLLKTLPRSTLASLFASMSSETFMPTDIITRAGAPAEDVYFISSGTVAVINSVDIEMIHLEDGDEFGFLVTTDGKMLYTHVAVETSEIYYISKKLFVEFLGAHPEFFKYFENKVMKRIQKYNIIESNLLMGGHDVLSSLKSGKLLEKQAIRSVYFDMES